MTTLKDGELFSGLEDNQTIQSVREICAIIVTDNYL